MICVRLFQQVQTGFLQIVRSQNQFAIQEGDDLPLLNLDAVDLNTASGNGDFASFHIIQRGRHIPDDRIKIAVRGQAQHGSQTLGDGRARDHRYLFNCQLRRGLSSQNDILIIGQNDNMIGWQIFERVDDLLGAWIHRLAPLDDFRYPKAGKHPGDS